MKRTITCPQCEAAVTLPWLWIFGLEMIFRCPECNLPLKTGYKMGAVLGGLSLALATVSVQLLVFLFSNYTLWLFVPMLLPLWVLYGFVMRRAYLQWKVRRRFKKQMRNRPEEQTEQ